MRSFILFCLLLSVGITSLQAQEQTYRVGLIGFYNFENLFDTLDTPDVRDTEFSPTGSKLYGTRIYREKLGNLAQVISEMGTDLSTDGLALLGVAEVENRSVLEDFVKEPAIAERNYQIVHYDSPDKRGIDVGLLYNPKYFQVESSRAVPLEIFTPAGERKYTRDILFVSGKFDGEQVYVMVNHWPSRSGGEKNTQEYRNAAAFICKSIVDSLYQVDPMAKVIIMGDLNDDPISPSIKKVLHAKGKAAQTGKKDIFNPMYEPFKSGNGTLTWNGAWNLFDQILITSPWLDKKQDGYFYQQVEIYKKPYLLQRTGKYKGSPHRTFSGDLYIGGYSDHLPVYIVLLKRM
ncbi:MAG: hypothetical protein KDC34_02665 [Saprospiraceae bacterium]|nr:hypothetical protein [Saprospiraceae bacterium]